jgi:hypothetical protein
VVGAKVLGGITALVLTLYVFVLTGHANILLSSCTGSRHPVCLPPDPWEWVFPIAGFVGAAASAVGTSMLLRHRSRLLHNSAPPLAPTISAELSRPVGEMGTS